jgi:hypothetical protein
MRRQNSASCRSASADDEKRRTVIERVRAAARSFVIPFSVSAHRVSVPLLGRTGKHRARARSAGREGTCPARSRSSPRGRTPDRFRLSVISRPLRRSAFRTARAARRR